MLKSLSVAADTAHNRSEVVAYAPASATISLVTTPAALRDMEVSWRELEGDTQSHTSVFQSFDWVMAWAETYAKPGCKDTLHVVTAFDGDELIFIWPLMRSKRYGLSILSWLTDPFGQYGDVLVRKGHCPKQWVDLSIQFLKRLNDVDLVRLRHVREDSHVAQHAKQFFIDAKMTEGAPYLDLNLFADDAAYDARYTSAQRKRRKKIRKSLENLGEVSFERLPAGSTADVAMASAINEKNQWLKERGRFNRVLGCAGHLDFLKALSRRRGGTVELVVTELKAGGKPISWEIGFRHQGTHYAYITSHVNAHTDLSPGRLHMDLSQRACLADGLKAFDLMVPNDAHKETWSSATAITNDCYLPLSWPGRLAGRVFLRTLRPIIRKIYYGLSADMLSKLGLGRLFGPKLKPPTTP
jgi:CelD/BcsL family acetyltransferase involved in cellulose biosynthesis